MPGRLVVGSSQEGAIQSDRTRLGERGLVRFKVLGREADGEVIRSLARRLTEEGPDAARRRAAVTQSIAGAPPRTGGSPPALPPLSGGLTPAAQQVTKALLTSARPIFAAENTFCILPTSSNVVIPVTGRQESRVHA
jgi:hypothetical protein